MSAPDSEVTAAQIADILKTHKVGKSDMDCDEGCCWQHYCTCGALIYPTLEDHIASVLQASFVVVPKGQLHQEWGWDVMGRKKPNPNVVVGKDGRPVTEPPKLVPELRLYSRLVGPWRPA